MNKLTVLLSLLLLVGFVSADTPCTRYVSWVYPTDFTNTTIYRGQNLTVTAYLYWNSVECGTMTPKYIYAYLESDNSVSVYPMTATSNISTCTNQQTVTLSGRSYQWTLVGNNNSNGSYHYKIYAYATLGATRTAISNATYINVNYSSYQHTTNVSSTPAICADRYTNFRIDKPSLTVDCKGYKLFGNNLSLSAGVNVTGNISTKIKNCDMYNFSVGINLVNASSTIINNVSFSNVSAGLFINNSNDVSVNGLKVYNTQSYVVHGYGHREYFNNLLAVNFSTWGFVINGNNWTIANSSLSAPNMSAQFQQVIRMNYTSTNITFMNVSANFSNATFATSTIAQNFTVAWLMRVNVTDNQSTQKDATILVKNNASIVYYNSYNNPGITSYFVVNSTYRYGDLTNVSVGNISVYVNTTPTWTNLTYWNFSTYSGSGKTLDYWMPTVNITMYMANFSCNKTITTNITLGNDITGTGTCFTFASDNVTLDCNNYTITFGTAGGSDVYGVYNLGNNGTTIKNCKINEGSSAGSRNTGLFVDTNGARNLTFANNTVSMYGYNGVALFAYNLLNSSIYGNSLNTLGEYGYGLYIYGNSRNVTQYRNTIVTYDNPGYGIIWGGYALNMSSVFDTSWTVYDAGTSTSAFYIFGGVNNSYITNFWGSAYADECLWLSDSVQNINITGSFLFSQAPDSLGLEPIVRMTGGTYPVKNIIIANSTIDTDSFTATYVRVENNAYDVYLLNSTYNGARIYADRTAPYVNNITTQWYLNITTRNRTNTNLNVSTILVNNASQVTVNTNTNETIKTIVNYYTFTYLPPYSFSYKYNTTVNKTDYYQNSSNNTVWTGNGNQVLTLYPIVPTVTFVAETLANNSNSTETWAFVNVTTSIPVQNATLNFNRTIYNMTAFNSTNWYYNVTGLLGGTYIYNVSANTTVLAVWGKSENRTLNVFLYAPNLTWVGATPANGSVQSVSTAYFNLSSNISIVNCSLNMNGSWSYMLQDNTTTFYKSYAGLPDGNYTFNATCNTSYSTNGTSETWSFLINTTVPDYTIPMLNWTGTTPLNNTYQNATGAYFNLTTNMTVQNCSLTVNGLEVLMDFANYTNAYHTIAGLGDGEYVFYANCTTSTSMNGTSETRNFSVDSIPPALTFIFPTPANNSIVHANYTVINVTLSEPLGAVMINWNGTIQLMNSSSPTNWYINETNLSNGNYQYWTFGTDSAGNMGWSEVRNVTIRKFTPILINESITRDLIYIEDINGSFDYLPIFAGFTAFISCGVVFLGRKSEKQEI